MARPNPLLLRSIAYWLKDHVVTVLVFISLAGAASYGYVHFPFLGADSSAASFGKGWKCAIIPEGDPVCAKELKHPL